jgi:hypothetical protein
MNKINYQKELEKILKNEIIGYAKKRLLLHACCAPCSSYVLEYLSKYFDIDVYFYNPNISSKDEYCHRADELVRFTNEMDFENKVATIIADYNPDEFYNEVKGLENCKEGGNRCIRCYNLRLKRTAQLAKQENYDYFSTTLSISPLKNSAKINEIGKSLENKYGVSYLYSDFKKKNGFKRSVELSNEYKLYRQNFCGCVYSKRDN